MGMDAIVYIGIGIVIGLACGAGTMFFVQMKRVLGLERQNAELSVQINAEQEALAKASASLDDRFKVTAQEALQKSSEQFLQLAQEKLKGAQADSAHDLEKRQKAINDMVKPVQEKLTAMSAALEQVKGTDQTLREQVQHLNRETARLVGALRDPSAQGVWGEFVLEGLLEKSGLIKGVHYKTQVTDSAGLKPDAVIEMQDGFNIIIDAKAPINEFTQRLSEDLTEDEHNRIMSGLAVKVRSRVKDVSSKNYWENTNSPDFTVLFLPSEHIYSMALRADPSIVEFAASKSVIIASPTLLMSLLRVVGMSWRQVELAQNAQEISNLGYDLYKRFIKFTEHFEKVGGHLQKAMVGYDSAVGSFERQVLPAARKFKELQGAKVGLENVPEIEKVEKSPRALALAAEDEQEKKRA